MYRVYAFSVRFALRARLTTRESDQVCLSFYTHKSQIWDMTRFVIVSFWHESQTFYEAGKRTNRY